tara:strand:- start:118 stop:279 length:162 start_codon:yes stop_codon:yes gene_type:complete
LAVAFGGLALALMLLGKSTNGVPEKVQINDAKNRMARTPEPDGQKGEAGPRGK